MSSHRGTPERETSASRERHGASRFRAAGASPFWWAAGAALVAFACLLANLSRRFSYEAPLESRPILGLTALLVAAGVVYGVAALRARSDPPPIGLVLVVALLARIVLVVSLPIQEDDIYRYLWDGRVVAAGLDPYRSSPEDIDGFARGAAGVFPGDPALLEELVALRDSTPALAVVFSRINNRGFATVYPPFAQCVFALHAALVPPAASAYAQVVAMKAVLLLFDAGTLVLLLVLLRSVAMPAGLSVLYAWCPLVLKEVANSGHMDSIPTFFVVLALLAHVRRRGLLAGLALGAAVAAKVFALILLPLVCRGLAAGKGLGEQYDRGKQGGAGEAPGPRRAVGAALSVLTAALAVIVPFWAAFPDGDGRRAWTLFDFALSWEMHDAAFAWIGWAWESLVGGGKWAFSLGGVRGAVAWSHLLALGTVLAALAALIAALLVRTPREAPAPHGLRSAFAALAALFLLGPLGFPWYFLWCVPLLPFTTLRVWLFLPALLMVYYLRFWFWYEVGGPLAGFASGTELFDAVVVSCEFGAFFAALALEGLWTRRASRG